MFNDQKMRISNLKLFKNLLKIKNYISNLYSINKNESKKLHEPVMLNEILNFLVYEPVNFKIYLDMTFGAGGHSEEILKKNPNSIIYTLDRDPVSFDLANEMKNKYPNRIFPMNGKFSDLTELLKSYNVKKNSIDSALIDCGVSSIQFDNANRGFSLSKNGTLDMRMSCNKESDSITAYDIVNKLGEEELGKIIWKYGEEKMYKKIAHGIVYFRSAHGPIKTTKQLAEVIASTIIEKRADSLNRPTHVATKTFQALRIFVNNELNELYNGITQIYNFLKPGGRLAVISFHSLEDRIVKSHFHDVNISLNNDKESNKINNKLIKNSIKFKMNNAQNNLQTLDSFVKNLWQPLNKKVVLPTNEEIQFNPRARSAKLRIAIKN